MLLVASMICAVLGQTTTEKLSGTVVGPDGEPVAGAEVLLTGWPFVDPPILARGRTDAEGRFALERPAATPAEDQHVAPMLWVAKPGYRLASIRFSEWKPKATGALRVALRPPGKAEVRVEAPGGEPVAGARLRVQWLGGRVTYVPDEVGELVEATTDGDGLAVLDAGSNDEVTYVDVHSQAFGIQGRPFLPATSRPKRVWLRPVASLAGRLVAADPAMVKGWRVLAYTRTGDPASRDPSTTGFAEGTTDEQGRFSFPVIAPGGLQLELKPPRDVPLLPEVPDSSYVVEGRENAVEIPLRPAATVTGVIRERGTGRPVAGVELYFMGLRGGKTQRGRTDDQGRYTFSCLPGEKRISVFRTPPTHAFAPGQDWKDFTLPANVARFEVEPREVIRAAPPVRFVVRDEAGRPAALATIIGQANSRWIPKTTDEKGEFAVPGVAPGGEITIEVRQGDRMTEEPVRVLAGGTDAEPVPVTIRPGVVLSLTGRVVGPGGVPIPEAVVHVQYREQKTPRGRFPFPRPLQLSDFAEIRTGTDGTFRTPREIYGRNREFRVEASAEGFLPLQGGWVSSEGGDLLRLPDLSLRRVKTLRVVSGRVLDRDRKAVAGASLFQSGDARQRTATTTDGEGRFRLAGVAEGTALVFAEKSGFRFGGAIAAAGAAGVEIHLARLEEPPLSTAKPSPPVLSRDQERAMARELLAPLVVAARGGTLGQLGASVIPALARVDPDRVLEMVENRVVPPSSGLLDQIALAKSESDSTAAVTTIEADHDPFARASGFLAIAGAMPEAERPRQVELIDRALAEARRVEDPEARLNLLGRIADRWLEWGDVGRATPILREGQAIVASMPKDRFSFAAEEFAEVLAVIDFPAARDLFQRKGRTNVSPAEAATIDRHLGAAAVRLSAIDPAEAERLMSHVLPNPRDDSRMDEVLRICRKMARADLPRARRILESVGSSGDPTFSLRTTVPAVGLCLIAADLAASDPTGARKLLDEAFVRLREVAGSGRESTARPVPNIMAAALPIVARIEPDRLEERLWLAAACRPPLAEQPQAHDVHERILLAMLVSRYDRAMAAAIVVPALERLPELLADPSGPHFDRLAVIQAVAAHDPRSIAVILEALPDSARKPPAERDDWTGASIEAQVRLAGAQMLGLPVEERRDKALGVDPRLRAFGRVR